MTVIPTVGRIVHFHAPGTKDQPYPAVITHVWADDLVNLHVLSDGTFPLHEPLFTSVMRTDIGDDNCWSWPDHVVSESEAVACPTQSLDESTCCEPATTMRVGEPTADAAPE